MVGGPVGSLPSLQVSMSSSDHTMLGRYELMRKLATGGMAEVFLARAMGPGGFEKTLVVKRILPELAEDPSFVQMFLHEARLAAQLNHPNVVQIFDFGEVDGTYYLAMEFVDGPNLRTILRKSPGRQISVTLGARIISAACEGLAYAHEFADPVTGAPYGLVHRDVSSDNLLLARTGAVKVVDFGVAKVAGQVSTSLAGTVKGKIAYMPPEQILGEADLRSDVYALGVILYELAAGTRPYEQMPDVQLMTAILKRDPTPLLARAPDVPPDFAMIVDKALARRVEARFQDCRELAAALDDFIVGTGERVGTVQLAQLVGGIAANSTSATGLRAVGGSSPGVGSGVGSHGGSGSKATPTSGSYPSGTAPRAVSGSFPAVAPATSRPVSGSFPSVAPATSRPVSGSFPSVAPATSRQTSGSFPALAPVGSRPVSGTFPVVAPAASRSTSGSFTALELELAPVTARPVSGTFPVVLPSMSRPVSGSFPVMASLRDDAPDDATSPLIRPPIPGPRAPGQASTRGADEARAHAVLADAEVMRTYEAGPMLAPAAELAAVRAELERDETLNLLVRFPLHCARLVPAHPEGREGLSERLRGAVEGLLLCEAYAPLARLLERLESVASQGEDSAWVYETVRAALATTDQVQRLASRLREGAPADAEGLGRLLRCFGAEFSAAWIAVSDTMDVAGSREVLLLGLAGLANLDPQPFLERALDPRARRLADFVYVLEKGRVADRQRAFRQVLGRRDLTQVREVLVGVARAGTDEAHHLLVQALGDRAEPTRLQAIELLAQHFPERAFRALEPLLEPTGYQARSAAERVALWKAIGASSQPEAYYAIVDVLKQRPSLLQKSRVDALKLDALEGLAAMKGTQGAELLKAVAGDRTQSDVVLAAAKRFITRASFARELPRSSAVELRRWERTPSTPRDVLLDLLALSQAARLLDVKSPLLDTAFTRLRARLEGLLRREHRAMVSLRGAGVTFNGAEVQPASDADAALEGVAAAFSSRGIKSFAFAGPTVAPVELQHLVRWLAEGPAAEGVHTPNIARLSSPEDVERPAPAPVPAPPMSDPSRDAMVRYVDLVFALRAYLLGRRDDPTLALPDVRITLHEFAALMQSRAVRFHGLTPNSAGHDAVIFHHANVAVLALSFAAELGLPLHRMVELAEYAFFSDVGMYELSDQALLRAGELTAEDKQELLAARRASARLPFTRRGDAPSAAAWACVVVEHGLDWGAKNREGAMAQVHEVGLLGSLVSLAKTFDALTSRRSFRAAMTLEQALEVMTQKVNQRFRPELLPLFVRFVSRQSVRVLPRR